MSRRPSMIATSVRRVLAPALRSCPPECGIVSMTEVEVSPDLQWVTVSISALKDSPSALAHLKEQTSRLRGLLKKLELHRVPFLRFKIDTRGESAERLDTLLR
ncbi:MAG: ribosome-binding factor A [Patescibacteria group bacterium]